MKARGLCLAALVAAAFLALGGCTTNPMTGRSQFLMVSEEHAEKGSASAYAGMIGQYSKKNKLERDTSRAERVREITNRLIAEAVRFRPAAAKWNWEVEVIDDPKTVNAFCMAGGKMGIYTGFWEKLKATDDEIANVMGHEIGHALADHTRERMSVGMAAGVGAAVLGALSASRNQSDPYAMQRAQDTFALAAALAITLPNSRESESEADQIGIELAARAGFDPRAAVSLWKKMSELGGTPLEFFSTHPSPENRIQHLESLVAKVQPLYEKARGNTPDPQVPLFVGTNRNERVVESMSREDYAAKLAAEPQVMSFVAEEFETFKNGKVVFTCTFDCGVGYLSQKSTWKAMHEKQAWRDLAVSVVKVGYLNDLSYFLLGEAAAGLGHKEAAAAYYRRALDARKADKTCEGIFNTCDGFEIAVRAGAALAGK